MKKDFNKPTIEREHPIVKEGGKGVQKIWRFNNGFGASVIRFSIPNFINRKEEIGSYGVNEGLWELAVIKFSGKDTDNFKLCFDTPITSNVIGYLTEKKVIEILNKIEKLSGKDLK